MRPTKNNTAHIWHTTINQALNNTQITIKPITYVYLVNTLDHYMYAANTLETNPVGLAWLQALNQTSHHRKAIQQIGDRCLIISSLFTDRPHHHNTELIFYQQIGKSAYLYMATHHANNQQEQTLFHELSNQFTPITTALQQIKHHYK